MIYEKVYALCKQNGMTISRLEKECEISNATIRKWETNIPNADNLAKAANYFGVSIRGMSLEAQEYAKRFDALSNEKKKLATAYMQVVEATKKD